jgi:hypothetical protein
MRKLGIIQPGKLGDLIILLPVAYYYHRQGWQIVWPVCAKYIPSFAPHVDYVTYLPVSDDLALFHDEAARVLKDQGCERVLDLLFNFPNTPANTQAYADEQEYSFDEFKYLLAGVPFEEKWKLRIRRNRAREMDLYRSLVKQDDYVVCHFQASDRRIEPDLTHYQGQQIIEITPLTDDIFDWLMIIERARQLVFIESCFSNLVDQLGLKNPKMLLLKTGYYGGYLPTKNRHKGIPALRESWEVVGKAE